MKRPKTAFVSVIGAICLTVALGACGSSGSSSGTASGSSSTATAATTPANKPSHIVFRLAGSAYGKTMEQTAIADFERATGVHVVTDNTDEYTSFAKVDQSIAAGARPPYDCEINNQPYAYLDAIHHYSQPISPSVAPNLAHLASVARPTGLPLNSDGSWPYVGIYELSVPFVENSKLIPANAVTSWLDLTKPVLHKAVEVDGAYQSTAFGIAAALHVKVTSDPASMNPVWAFLSKLRNTSEAVNGTSIDAVRSLASHQVKLAITPPLDGVTARQQGVPIRFVVPKEGMIIVTDSFYIAKGIPQNAYYYCQKLANFLTSPTVQAQWAKQLGLVPTNPNAPIPSFMAKNPSVFPRTAAQIAAVHGIIAPVPLEARNQAQWQSAFNKATQ